MKQIIIHLLFLFCGCGAAWCLPPLWEQVPATLQDFPVVEGRTSVDPWEYRQRMGLYRVLLAETSHVLAALDPAWDVWNNMLWGLPIQHGWQYQTRRLQDFSANTTCGLTQGDTCISPYSWWGALSYQLSVLSFLGAMRAGYFSTFPRQIILQPARQIPHRFCTSVTDCRNKSTDIYDVIIKWSTFFKFLSDINNTESNGSGGEHGQLKDRYIYLLWEAHTACILASLPLYKDLLGLMGSTEARFGSDWSITVQFIAATDFQTNYNNTYKFQGLYLPSRLLTDNDLPPSIPDLPATINRALATLELLRQAYETSGGRFLHWWQHAMCCREGRAVGQELLSRIITSPSVVPGCLLRLAWFMLTRSCDRPIAVTQLIV